MYNENHAPDTLKDHIFYGLALDEEQQHFRDCIWDKDNIITICNSRAGTGKTTIALGVANLLYQYGFYKEIIYVVSPTMEQKQGFIPGNPDDKNAPYMEPLYQALLVLGLNPNTVIKSSENMQALKNGTAYITFTSHTYLRGTNFDNSVVIIDETENFYFSELKKVLTRIHDDCKVIMIGHTEQCDLFKRPYNSGFRIYLEAFDKIKDDPRVAICQLTTNHRGWLSTFCDDVVYEEK